jgi:hypothetical protein
LIPYKATAQSSGVLGYAAQFKRPVVAPNEKLLGKLVRKYHLGYTLKSSNSEDIAIFLREIEIIKIENKIQKNYLESNSVLNFVNIIFKNFGISV